MKHQYISNTGELEKFCESIADKQIVAFDTEFVSEDTYAPQLCLVQVAAGDHLAVIDPLAVDDLSPFWQLLTDGGRTTLVHAGREEFRFCRRDTGKRPSGWFDVQIAAGMVGLEYPAAYGALISKLLDKTLPKGETRTNWRRRPLSDRQIEYALQDVLYLEKLRELLLHRIDKLERRSWYECELEDWQRDLELFDDKEQWRRVSGINGLSSRALAIVREVWRWRNAEARERDRPPKRVLRDDLIVELARRQSAEVKHIQSVRGLDHRHLKRSLPIIAEAVQRALELPSSECPRPPANSRNRPHLNLLGQFLNAGLASVCRGAKIAPSIVGTVQDGRDLIAYRLKSSDKEPSLARGWRAQVVGPVIDDLLAGRLAIGVTDPLSDQPLSFVKTAQLDQNIADRKPTSDSGK